MSALVRGLVKKKKSSAHTDQANGGLNNALNCHARHHSRWKSLRRPREQRQKERPRLSCPSRQWLDQPTPTELTEARATHSSEVSAIKVAG
jgi:hypothetical protein